MSASSLNALKHTHVAQSVSINPSPRENIDHNRHRSPLQLFPNFVSSAIPCSSKSLISARPRCTMAASATPLSLSEACTPDAVFTSLTAVRSTRPLVHCITNFVSMEPVANTLLAGGAAPAMIHALPEVEEFASIASCLYVNIGTLSPEWVTSMLKAAHKVSTLGRPWVLDPVGAGATKYRTEVSRELLALSPTVVRGNASEISALAGAAGVVTRGVDSTLSSDAALDAARSLATASRSVVVVSGATDYITDGSRVLACGNGHPLLQAVTATGCSVTSLVAAFVAAVQKAGVATGESAAMIGAAHAMAVYGVSAEVAMNEMGARGPGSLRPALLDALYGLKKEQLTAFCKLRIVSP